MGDPLQVAFGISERDIGGGNRHPSLTKRRQKDRLTSWGVACQSIYATAFRLVYSFTTSIHPNGKFVNRDFLLGVFQFWGEL
jgi:hypothetical protein